jgi:hypothetical protein
MFYRVILSDTTNTTPFFIDPTVRVCALASEIQDHDYYAFSFMSPRAATQNAHGGQNPNPKIDH